MAEWFNLELQVVFVVLGAILLGGGLVFSLKKVLGGILKRELVRRKKEHDLFVSEFRARYPALFDVANYEFSDRGLVYLPTDQVCGHNYPNSLAVQLFSNPRERLIVKIFWHRLVSKGWALENAKKYRHLIQPFIDGKKS